jgi:cytidylate kinase
MPDIAPQPTTTRAAAAQGTATLAAPSTAAQPRRVTVALDGPASSGKSSVGAAAATRLGLRFFDTGLIYRALTAMAIREGVALDDPRALVPLAARLALADDGTGRMARVLLDGVDATEAMHIAAVDAAVSTVARVPEVRAALLERQRAIAAEGGIIVVGRDIGTVVLPDAPVKVFIDASVEARAGRRIAERGLDPAGEAAEQVREQLRARDLQDSTRAVAPLRPADDAVHVANEGTFEAAVDALVAVIRGTEEGRAR